jgi:hypothetical protein
MLKKTITFPDLDGNPVTEDFYFNLTKSELAEMELVTKGGMKAQLEEIIASNDGGRIIAVFRNLLAKSYGKKSDDNRRFIKSPELWEEFSQTNAYDVLFMELVTNATSGAEFVNAIMPADLVAQAQSQAAKKTIEVPLPQRLPGASLENNPVISPEDSSLENAWTSLPVSDRKEMLELIRTKRNDQ